MAGFNGSGTYIRPYTWVNDKANGIDITASRFDTDGNDVATALSNCICKDGQQTTTAMIPFAQGLSFADGTAMAPGLVVSGDTTTGFYQPSSGQIAFSSVGVSKVLFNANGIDNTPIGQGTAAIANLATTQITALSVTNVGTANGAINLYGNSSGYQIITVSSVIASGAKFQFPSSNGASGNVLITNGAGVTSWSAATGGLTLIATVNASAQATVVFNSTYITNAYNKYIIEFDGVYGSGTILLGIVLSTNNGSSYVGSGYSNAGTYQASNSSTVTGYNNTSNYIDLTASNNVGIGANATYVSNGTIKFSNPSVSQALRFISELFASSSTQNYYITGIGQNSGTTAINNIKIYDTNGGNITGNFHLYGLQGT